MPRETAPIDLLLQKLELDKATYLDTLNNVHEALARSLCITHGKVMDNDEGDDGKSIQVQQDSKGEIKPAHHSVQVVSESNPDFFPTPNGLKKRDPFSEETFFSDDDLEAFVNNLDTRITRQHLSPISTGKGFHWVPKIRVGRKDALSYSETILKLLKPLSSLQTAEEKHNLRHSRIHKPDRHWYNQEGHHQISSYNAACFAYLDDGLADPWMMYHDNTESTDPPNFWEILRVTMLFLNEDPADEPSG